MYYTYHILEAMQCYVFFNIYPSTKKSINKIDGDMGKATPSLQTIDFLFNEWQHKLRG